MESNLDLNKSLAEEIYKKNLELLEQRKRSEQLLYSVSETVFAINPDYNITLFNRAAEKMLNIKAKEVIGQCAKNIIKIETDKGDFITLESFCFQQDPEKCELEAVILRAPGQSYYVNVKSSTIEIADGTLECLVTLTDITHEKELEKTKNDFISVTSHELRTPMTIIKSYLWMLQTGKGGSLTVKQKEYIEKAVKGTERMLNLINDTLNISRIEQGRIDFKMEKFNYKELVNELSSEFKVRTDEKNIFFKLVVSPEIEMVWGDKNKVREVLTNFVGNSLKFTNSGGITIEIESVENNMVKTKVVDTGKGITKEDMPKLFHKFSRLDNSYTTIAENGGTGLGLYIVKSLVEAMGGSAGAFSEGSGKGCTFWFTLCKNAPDGMFAETIAPSNIATIPQNSNIILGK